MANATALQVGNVYNQSLSEIELLFNSDPVILFLRNRGPAALIQYLDPADAEELRNCKFVNQCHLCIKLFSNNENSEMLKKFIINKFEEQSLSYFFHK